MYRVKQCLINGFHESIKIELFNLNHIFEVFDLKFHNNFSPMISNFQLIMTLTFYNSQVHKLLQLLTLTRNELNFYMTDCL